MNRQTFYYPPPGRPGWTASEKDGLDLLYLAWGWRRYHHTPQRPSRREGWLYFMVLSGCPSLLLPEGKVLRVSVKKGDFVILHPDCFCGWEDAPEAKSEICTWVWHTPSRWKTLHPAEEEFLHFRLDADTSRAIQALHQQTRREIQYPDGHTPLAIEALRLQTDLVLARSLPPHQFAISDKQRVALARRWIEEHAGEHRPVSGICDYLQISPVALNRMFRKHLKTSVHAYATKRRLLRAMDLIHRQKRSVKETAFSLGYRFPNDLSRALRNFGSK